MNQAQSPQVRYKILVVKFAGGGVFQYSIVKQNENDFTSLTNGFLGTGTETNPKI